MSSPVKTSAPIKFKFKGDKKDNNNNNKNKNKNKKKENQSDKDKRDDNVSLVNGEISPSTASHRGVEGSGVGSDDDSEDEYLTAAQRKQKNNSRNKESEVAKANATVSYRQRVAMFNEKLATASEHNDIPRVSAAGNG